MRSVRQTGTDYKVEDKVFWEGRFWAQSETVNKWWKVIAVCSKLDRHVQMMVDERGWIIWMGNPKWCRKLVKHVGRSGEWLWVMMMVWSEWHKVKSVCCDREEAEWIQGHRDMVASKTDQPEKQHVLFYVNFHALIFNYTLAAVYTIKGWWWLDQQCDNYNPMWYRRRNNMSRINLSGYTKYRW